MRCYVSPGSSETLYESGANPVLVSRYVSPGSGETLYESGANPGSNESLCEPRGLPRLW